MTSFIWPGVVYVRHALEMPIALEARAGRAVTLELVG